jgi:hypothetical protein
MFQIAQFFRIDLRELIAANPQIRNPEAIFPGDILCVPGLVPYPCSIVLQRATSLPTGTEAAALVYLSASGTQAISVIASLPQPFTLGAYDIYVAEAIVPEAAGGPGDQLFPTPEEPPTWSTTISFPTALRPTPNTVVQIRPSNSTTGASGEVILSAVLSACRPMASRRITTGRRSPRRRRRRRTHN